MTEVGGVSADVEHSGGQIGVAASRDPSFRVYRWISDWQRGRSCERWPHHPYRSRGARNGRDELLKVPEGQLQRRTMLVFHAPRCSRAVPCSRDQGLRAALNLNAVGGASGAR
jgi:hypothetical protein